MAETAMITISTEEKRQIQLALRQRAKDMADAIEVFKDIEGEYPKGSAKAEHWAQKASQRRSQIETIEALLERVDAAKRVTEIPV